MIQKPIANTYKEQVALLNPEKPIKVYRNLNRTFGREKGFWSVRQGTVKFHCQAIFLKNVTFPVNERVRLEVVRDKKKQVHAYVEGFIIDRPTYFDNCEAITYNPYENKKFVCCRGEVKAAEGCMLVRLSGGKMRVYASNILTEAEASGMIESVPVYML
jgi:hypothetical protein